MPLIQSLVSSADTSLSMYYYRRLHITGGKRTLIGTYTQLLEMLHLHVRMYTCAGQHMHVGALLSATS